MWFALFHEDFANGTTLHEQRNKAKCLADAGEFNA